MTREDQDTAIQSSRDQGIADACAGRAARYWFSLWVCSSVFSGDRNDIKTVRRVPMDSDEYRTAFAYARAYEANK